MNINAELFLGIIVNIVAIAYFAGIHSATQKSMQKNINDLKEHFQEKFEWLARKQDKHNNVIERVYCLEKNNSIQDEQIKVVNHRIEDLEEKTK